MWRLGRSRVDNEKNLLVVQDVNVAIKEATGRRTGADIESRPQDSR